MISVRTHPSTTFIVVYEKGDSIQGIENSLLQKIAEVKDIPIDDLFIETIDFTYGPHRCVKQKSKSFGHLTKYPPFLLVDAMQAISITI